jgi:DNA polymerase III alpha subunit (gram-positive type)
MTANSPGESNPMSLLERDLVFLDCEMTGGSLDRHDIIEIGAVRARLPELANLGELSIKVAPRGVHGADPQSLRVAGYSLKAWKEAAPVDEALRRLETFAAGSLAVGWATYNDLLFLQAAAQRAGIEGILGSAYLEVQDWAQARLHFGRAPGLQGVANQLKIVRDQEHSAIEDALVTFEVFRLLWRHSPEEFDLVLPTLDWTSYATLAGEIQLDPADAEARRRELARYVVTDSTTEALFARRSNYPRND